MQPIERVEGTMAPLDRADVDTDQIIPKQFLKRVERTGYGPFLFFDWRQDPSFFLNQAQFEGAAVLVAGANFGCGSSREHAPWAIRDAGIRCLIASSFADIFYNNCFNNSILPVTLDEATVRELMNEVEANEGYTLTVDLAAQTITTP